MGREVMRVNCEAVAPSPAETARVEETESAGVDESKIRKAQLHRVSFERPFSQSMLEATHLYRCDNSFFQAKFEDDEYWVVQ